MPGQGSRHFADDIFKCNFINDNVSISTEISLKFVPQDLYSIYEVDVTSYCKIDSTLD